jgi:hypothetical protein
MTGFATLVSEVGDSATAQEIAQQPAVWRDLARPGGLFGQRRSGESGPGASAETAGVDGRRRGRLSRQPARVPARPRGHAHPRHAGRGLPLAQRLHRPVRRRHPRRDGLRDRGRPGGGGAGRRVPCSASALRGCADLAAPRAGRRRCLLVGVVYTVVAQLYALLSSVRAGLQPDNPLPSGKLNRVVRGVTVHPYPA